MDAETKERLERLADYIQSTNAPLSITRYLQFRGRTDPGYNILGLICEAYERFTGSGRWILSNRNVPEIPDFLSGGGMEDDRLPKAVADYFGLRDQIGSFYVGELPQDVKNLMRRTRKTEGFTLHGIGFSYPKNGKDIAARIIRAMPSSLLKPDLDDPPGLTPILDLKPKERTTPQEPHIRVISKKQETPDPQTPARRITPKNREQLVQFPLEYALYRIPVSPARHSRFRGNPELGVTFQYRQDHLETVLGLQKP